MYTNYYIRLQTSTTPHGDELLLASMPRRTGTCIRDGDAARTPEESPESVRLDSESARREPRRRAWKCST